jgi:predicted TIM-barrel fold metal-dependent hydrolase
MQLIDVHAHFVTDSYVAAATAGGNLHPDGMPGYPSWDAAKHLEMMDDLDIATAVLSMSSPGVHFGDDAAARVLAREVNCFAAEVARTHPGRFGHFASLPLPDVAGSIEEAGYALEELSSNGVAVHTNHAGVYLGNEAYEPLWSELNMRAAVVFVHPTSAPCAELVSMGRPRPMLEFIFDTTRAVSDLIFSGVLERYPRIRWVFTHGGGSLPLMADRMEMFRRHLLGWDEGAPTVHELIARLWFDMAGTPFPNQIPALARVVGFERLLYGSDYCWTPSEVVGAQIAQIDEAQPPAGAGGWRDLATLNAKRLLPDI